MSHLNELVLSSYSSSRVNMILSIKSSTDHSRKIFHSDTFPLMVSATSSLAGEPGCWFPPGPNGHLRQHAAALCITRETESLRHTVQNKAACSPNGALLKGVVDTLWLLRLPAGLQTEASASGPCRGGEIRSHLPFHLQNSKIQYS